MLGCLIFIGLIVVSIGAGGIYIWRATTYTPPVRKAPDIPERASGTLIEFPVDTEKSAPARPTSVQTESLTNAKATSSSPAKLPPGVDRSRLSKGATTMTSATYRPPPRTQNATPSSTSTNEEIYICVLTAMPNEPNFGDDLAKLVTGATSGQKKSWGVKSKKGPEYKGWQISSPQASVYVLTKQSDNIVILIYGPDPSTKDVVDRLALNVGDGEGLNDYPEVKESLWTLPAATPTELTLLEISTLTGTQIENSVGSGGDLPSQMRPFIPDRMSAARYTDSGRQEWVALNLEYGSSFQAWRTWLLARGALGLSGAQSTTVRDVNGLYVEQEGKRILVFQKGPYLIFLSGPSSSPLDRIVALGNQFQV